MTEKERLETQARSFEFYAGLIERAIGRGAALPVWGPMTAEEYRDLARQYRERAAALPEQEQTAAHEAPNQSAAANMAAASPTGEKARTR
ncbi:MAG TPA: hypothetical protein VFU32_10575 [Ktedonobacterales bacterium]|nr:hypothetical protein [Ktedonobacterales bacterium]